MSCLPLAADKQIQDQLVVNKEITRPAKTPHHMSLIFTLSIFGWCLAMKCVCYNGSKVSITETDIRKTKRVRKLLVEQKMTRKKIE